MAAFGTLQIDITGVAAWDPEGESPELVANLLDALADALQAAIRGGEIDMSDFGGVPVDDFRVIRNMDGWWKVFREVAKGGSLETGTQGTGGYTIRIRNGIIYTWTDDFVEGVMPAPIANWVSAWIFKNFKTFFVNPLVSCSNVKVSSRTDKVEVNNGFLCGVLLIFCPDPSEAYGNMEFFTEDPGGGPPPPVPVLTVDLQDFMYTSLSGEAVVLLKDIEIPDGNYWITVNMKDEPVDAVYAQNMETYEEVPYPLHTDIPNRYHAFYVWYVHEPE